MFAATEVLARVPTRRERRCSLKRFIAHDTTTHTNRKHRVYISGGGRPRWQVTGPGRWADPDIAGGWLLGAFIHCSGRFSYNGEQ
ncbi:hypothetical protein T11_10518 [Trichinella zimbabwensis]|uniref:Uncharacterized protein n=1 Tax=Trichinella zimbabwensis TaxID=268475 RepID=A0A0V1GVQ0_9BILA|nr:hypothetical protein T11_11397 [Trichinella zimbabwensis]KRZ11446.1 hypothetical protein T11_1293 [Trichinella zimbabwensis]KRZ11519.1 hypothetical protein T11_10518 [Trichinella zimbabwensis]